MKTVTNHKSPADAVFFKIKMENLLDTSNNSIGTGPAYSFGGQHSCRDSCSSSCLNVSELSGIFRDLGQTTAEDASLSCGQIALIQALTAALDSNGYLHIYSDIIQEKLVAEVVDASREFFGAPIEQKLLAVSKDKARRGYSPINTENFASLIGQSAPNDIVEKFRIGPVVSSEDKELDSEYYGTKSGRIYFFENSWSGTSSSFRDSLEGLYKSLSELAVDVLCALAMGVQLPPYFFIDKMKRPTSIMSVNCYSDRHSEGSSEVITPSSSSSCAGIRVNEHTDVSLLTFVIQSGPGLQIKNKSTSEWEVIPYIPGSIFVHVGDCLQYWSRNRFVSTLHRVIVAPKDDEAEEHIDVADDVAAATQRDRISIAFFTTPDYDAVLDWPMTSSSSTREVTNVAIEPKEELKQYQETENIQKPMYKTSKMSRSNDGKAGKGKDSAMGADAISFDVWRKKKIAQSIACVKNVSK